MAAIARHRWYIARMVLVGSTWQAQVVKDRTWDAQWKARNEARQHDGFSPMRGEVLMLQKNVVFVDIKSISISEKEIAP